MAYYYHLQKLQRHWNLSGIATLTEIQKVIESDRDYFDQFSDIETLLRMVARYVIDRQKFDTLYSEWEPVRVFERVN